jgi:uncharacterized protein (TIGR03118 family)
MGLAPRNYGFAIVAILALTPMLSAGTLGFLVTNLTSNQPGVAPFQDTKLQNAWGLASSASSPFWVGDNATGFSTVYTGSGSPVSTIAVHIPGDGSVTGVTFTATGTTAFSGDSFLFASEDGTVSGWRGALGLMGTAEVIQTGVPANEYKGITYADVGGSGYAFLANFATGNVDVLKGTVGAPDLTGKFIDPSLPAGYTPFNVQVIGNSVYVAYAIKNGTDELDGPGLGIVDRFDLNGNFLARIGTGGDLNAPWGLAIAPAGFPIFGGDLLVGNFGDGKIHAYNATSGGPLGAVQDPLGNDVAIDGLWGLRFGNGASGGTLGSLYFTAGPDDESNGLFGRLDPTPEPATWWLAGVALLPLLRRATRVANPRGRD